MIDSNLYPDVDLFHQKLDRGRGTLTIIRGGWNAPNPKTYMDEVVRQYVEDRLYNQFVEIHLDIPQVRVVVEGINNLTYVEISEFYTR